jgi:cellulose biosynthesis protein BcsQ
LINQRGSAEIGTYDLLRNPGQLDRALRRTVVHGLQILPASNRDLREALIAVDRTTGWRGLIRRTMGLADVVIVDCPAGMSHTTLEILQSVSHVLGVFQAETVASRSFEMFERGLDTLGESERPAVAGVVVNMLRQEPASARAYESLVAGDASRLVFQTAITRSEAFEEAAAAATPVRLHSGDASRKMAWLFDNLAAEVASRLRLAQPPPGKARSFMI